MYIDLLPFLCCPACRGQLAPRLFEIDRAGEALRGELTCAACDITYPIRQGIADFLGPPRPPTPAQVVNEWPLTAWGYERLWRPFALTLLSGERFPYRRELPLVARLLDPHGGLFVDVACSNGLYARAIARTTGGAAQIVGVDHSFSMLVDARRRARAAGLPVSYVRAKAQALPIASSAAAGVVVGGSLNEIVDLDGSLSEARRVLAPDGRFVAMSLVRAQTAAGRALQTLFGSGGIEFWAPDQLVERFARHGLRTVERARYGVVLFTRSVA